MLALLLVACGGASATSGTATSETALTTDSDDSGDHAAGHPVELVRGWLEAERGQGGDG